MPDEPSSDWTKASWGIYGLTIEELRLIVLCIHEYVDAHGRWPSATDVQAALRRPGL